MPKVKVKEHEREVELADTYEMVMYQRKKFLDLQMTGKVVIRAKDREWEQGRQGRLKYYLQPTSFSDAPLRDWIVFVNDIRKHSGKHRHQGGAVIFVLEGRGYSVVDGVRYDWEAGDLLLLPCKEGGVEHQHFNLAEGQPCKWIAFFYLPYWDLMVSEFTQGELSPDFNPKARASVG